MLTESDTDNEDIMTQSMLFPTMVPPSFENFSFDVPQTLMHTQASAVVSTLTPEALEFAVTDDTVHLDEEEDADVNQVGSFAEEENLDAGHQSAAVAEVRAFEVKNDEEPYDELADFIASSSDGDLGDEPTDFLESSSGDDLDDELADFLASSSDDDLDLDHPNTVDSDCDDIESIKRYLHHPSKSTLIDCANNLHHARLTVHIKQLYQSHKSALDTVNIVTADVHPIKKRAELRMRIRDAVDIEFNNVLASTSRSLLHLALLSDNVDALHSIPLRLRMKHDRNNKSSNVSRIRYRHLVLAVGVGALLQYFY